MRWVVEETKSVGDSWMESVEEVGWELGRQEELGRECTRG